jgi:competence protein ComEA
MLSSIVALSVLATIAPSVVQGAQALAGPQSTTKQQPVAVTNINTASVKELDALPGVGAKTAALIVEYRQKNGPFKKVEELMNVKGIGEKSFLKLKPQLTVTAPKSEHAAE